MVFLLSGLGALDCLLSCSSYLSRFELSATLLSYGVGLLYPFSVQLPPLLLLSHRHVRRVWDAFTSPTSYNLSLSLLYDTSLSLTSIL